MLYAIWSRPSVLRDRRPVHTHFAGASADRLPGAARWPSREEAATGPSFGHGVPAAPKRLQRVQSGDLCRVGQAFPACATPTFPPIPRWTVLFRTPWWAGKIRLNRNSDRPRGNGTHRMPPRPGIFTADLAHGCFPGVPIRRRRGTDGRASSPGRRSGRRGPLLPDRAFQPRVPRRWRGTIFYFLRDARLRAGFGSTAAVCAASKPAMISLESLPRSATSKPLA